MPKLITLAIHTYDRAHLLRSLLESEGIEVQLQNVNLEQPEVSAGMRVRIHQSDLPLALRIVENAELFAPEAVQTAAALDHSILVPVDMSRYSLDAARLACRLAQRHHVGITLLHSYLDPDAGPEKQLTARLNFDSGDRGNAVRHSAHLSFDDFAGRLTEEMKGGLLPPVKFVTHLSEGVPEDVIMAHTKQMSPRLIVMGTRSSERKEREMVGSVTAQVLDNSRVPVLAIPETYHLDGSVNLKRAVFFANLDQQDLLAVDALARLFPDSAPHITIIPIPNKRKTANPSAMATLLDYCRHHYPSFEFEALTATPETLTQVAHQATQTLHPQLLLIAHKHRSALYRFFNPGLAQAIILKADLPLLVIPV